MCMGLRGQEPFNQGGVFELTPGSGSFWNVTVLHTFKGQTDGNQPWAGVVLDRLGNLYGTTTAGGSYKTSCGTVFQLTLSHGVWAENILHVFTCKEDGWFPTADLVLDTAGNGYGTTWWGGVGCGGNGCGTVFKLSQSNGAWTKQTIYSFKGGADGIQPTSALVFDKAGNLYGTTSLGGIGPCDIMSTPGYGTVFKLTPRRRGEWKKTTLYGPDGSTGGGLFGGVVFDRSGNLYGPMTFYGKTSQDCGAGCGSVFKLTPGKAGNWTATTLHQFKGADGGEPFGHLLLDRAGNIFGITYYLRGLFGRVLQALRLRRRVRN